ncbi:MAG TPA: hypothetical protein VIB48_13485 [Acidimicrobiia bacterium]|jgi:hypothetical protein
MDELTTRPRHALTIAGVLAGIVFAVGFFSVIIIPGLGGTSTTKDFTDFYNSNGKRSAADLLLVVLTVGCWLMVWLFTELRARLAGSARVEVAHRLSVVAASAVMIGAAIEAGPSMVQNNSDNAKFVGVPIAHTFAQAGAAVVIMGMFTFAAAVFLYGLDLRRSVLLPAWLGTVSLVIAILLVGSFFVLPGLLLPIWAVIVGVVGRDRTKVTAGGLTENREPLTAAAR